MRYDQVDMLKMWDLGIGIVAILFVQFKVWAQIGYEAFTEHYTPSEPKPRVQQSRWDEAWHLRTSEAIEYVRVINPLPAWMTKETDGARHHALTYDGVPIFTPILRSYQGYSCVG